MGGVSDAIFGSGGESSSVEDITPPEFVGLRGPIASQLQQIFSAGGLPAASGPYAAPLTPTEQSLVSQIGQAAGPSPLINAASQQLQSVISGQGLSPDSNPFLAATIDAAIRPIIETFEQDTLPGLRGLFTRAGQQVQNLGSSPFAEALARERTGVANAIGDVATNLAGQNFQAERARQQEAAIAAPAFAQADLERISQGLEAVALPRLVEQYGIDMGIEEFRRRQESLLQALQIAGGLASPTAAVLPGQAPTTGLLGALVSGFGSAAAGG